MFVDLPTAVLWSFQPFAMVVQHRVDAAIVGDFSLPDYLFHLLVATGSPQLFKLVVQVKNHGRATESARSPTGMRMKTHDEKCSAVEAKAEVFVFWIMAYGRIPRCVAVSVMQFLELHPEFPFEIYFGKDFISKDGNHGHVIAVGRQCFSDVHFQVFCQSGGRDGITHLAIVSQSVLTGMQRRLCAHAGVICCVDSLDKLIVYFSDTGFGMLARLIRYKIALLWFRSFHSMCFMLRIRSKVMYKPAFESGYSLTAKSPFLFKLSAPLRRSKQ